MNIEKATRSELEVAALENDDLFNFLGKEAGILAMNLEELRDKITEWIIEGNEATC